MPMKAPCHPGEIVLHECIEPLGVSVEEAAGHMRISAELLAEICAGRARVSADTAIRFEQAFGSTADVWLGMQSAYDIAEARRTDSAPKIERIVRAA